jgi:hypothetical protein
MSRRLNRSVLGECGALPNWRIHRGMSADAEVRGVHASAFVCHQAIARNCHGRRARPGAATWRTIPAPKTTLRVDDPLGAMRHISRMPRRLMRCGGADQASPGMFESQGEKRDVFKYRFACA